MTEHTPTPWAVMGNRGDIKSVCQGFPETMVAKALGQPTREERAANAAFIVKAVNSHDALTAVRTTFLGYLQAENGCKRSGAPCRETCACEMELQGLVSAWGGGAVSSPPTPERGNG